MARTMEEPSPLDRIMAAVSIYLTIVLAAVVVFVAVGRSYAKELDDWRVALALGGPLVAGWLLGRGHLGGWLVGELLRRGRS
jgi:uncharacterized membrane protein YfcA